jgi:hypothetical protein
VISYNGYKRYTRSCNVERDAFRVSMEEETAKGLHFPRARYAPIRRTGALAAESDGFKADSGQKAMKSLDAHGITAKFDPWGVFLRQWRFTDVHVQSGDVEIQIYEANPEAVPGKPWFAIFLPNRVYLEKIESEQTNITWHLSWPPVSSVRRLAQGNIWRRLTARASN